MSEDEPYGLECDLWSLGVSFYQMLTGKVPYEGRSDKNVLNQIIKG